jgi:hypothetical protein
MARIYRRANHVRVFLEGSSIWLESDWFTRRWEVQEFIAASQVVVHYDGNMQSWESLTKEIPDLGIEKLPLIAILFSSSAKSNAKVSNTLKSSQSY